jgi:hypothetical protein
MVALHGAGSAGQQEDCSMRRTITKAFAAAALVGAATLASEAVAFPGPGTGSALDRSASVVEQLQYRDQLRPFRRARRAAGERRRLATQVARERAARRAAERRQRRARRADERRARRDARRTPRRLRPLRR